MEKTPIWKLIESITLLLIPIYKEKQHASSVAWWLVQWISGKTQADLIAHDSIILSPEQHAQLMTAIREHVELHKPLQYIIGSVEFLGLTIDIQPPILIPRPETEEWADSLIRCLKKYNVRDISIADICTGSGCIALALAKHLPESHVYASDINPLACELTRFNALKNGIHNITVLESHLFAAFPSHERFDLIVSNPPYISSAEYHTLDPVVRLWEDPRALEAPDNGLAIITQILQQTPDWLKTPTQTPRHVPELVMEIGYNQGPKTKEVCIQSGFTHAEIHKDLEGHDRTLWARI